ncbi:Undecaprenyl-phosphate galactose phosphotransferase [Sulfuricurvum kujiense DSM 16994]|uniref:Undecaprenyl-phosphate galactose phosphotransferase n=1 Tax=Sulfuricurvum kujiense (strain ATCC BAA-921 / DSM 16994 / JCM 11577 / YK-1) TaxID=709032 RepID=E4TYC5_SULKY|nr:undecaprenyl phosphate N,N'-diacetylbacillosamine 1-phosphate transferase [Sulfuricurvum kujiense]ADR35070.1 Undecaprenyl-phosphate galactose phosphotransferase [Sulfuricurvum kujiense DSM 16994]
MYKQILKPLSDRVGALFLLILVSPLILIVAATVYLKLGRPLFFTQKRPGYKGKIFTIYKFRTMSDERDENGELLSDEQRLKGVGKIIRSLSIDELPQLFNVLKGEMSFIGPRPLLVEYLPLYNAEQQKRHDVLPGITGWAQVNGRNAIGWEDKFRFDTEYVRNISFWMDFKILFLTVKKVLIKEGISQEGAATMEKFKGNG